MTVKISITLEDDVAEFVKAQGGNRSKFINRVLKEAKKAKLRRELKAAYIDQNNDPEFWLEFEIWDTAVGDGLDEQENA